MRSALADPVTETGSKGEACTDPSEFKTVTEGKEAGAERIFLYHTGFGSDGVQPDRTLCR